MSFLRYVRPPSQYVPPTKPLSFHQNIIQGTVHRDRILSGAALKGNGTYLYHRDAFQPLPNVIVSATYERQPVIVSKYGKSNQASHAVGWLFASGIGGVMLFLSFGFQSTQPSNQVQVFESVMVKQKLRRIPGSDLVEKQGNQTQQ